MVLSDFSFAFLFEASISCCKKDRDSHVFVQVDLSLKGIEEQFLVVRRHHIWMCLVFTGLGTADMLHLYSRVGTCLDNLFQEKNSSTDPYLRKFMRKNEFDRDMFLCEKFNASILHESSLMYNHCCLYFHRSAAKSITEDQSL